MSLVLLALSSMAMTGGRELRVSESPSRVAVELVDQRTRATLARAAIGDSCDGDAWAFARGTLPWDAYALAKPALAAFFEKHRDVVAKAPCPAERRERIEEALLDDGLDGVLADAKLDFEKALLEAYRDAYRAGRVAPPIARTAPPAGPIREPVLIVTHASSVFDADGVTREGVDRAVRRARESGRKVIYLMNDDRLADAGWLAEERHPDHALPSRSGEHQLELDFSEVTVAGGFYTLCQAETVSRLVKSYFRSAARRRPLVVRFPLDATYSDKASHRLPGRENEIPPALLSITHYPSLLEILERMGPRDFLRSLPLPSGGRAKLSGKELVVEFTTSSAKL